MFRVEEIYFVEASGFWAVSLKPDVPERPALEVGDELVAGMRRWRVNEILEAPPSLVGARLAGTALITRGLIMRPSKEPMGAIEFKASSILLIRLARAFRAADVDGVLKLLADRARAKGGDGHEMHLDPADRAIAKTALMGKHLVESGATDEELAEAARAIGIGGEL